MTRRGPRTRISEDKKKPNQDVVSVVDKKKHRSFERKNRRREAENCRRLAKQQKKELCCTVLFAFERERIESENRLCTLQSA
ncbi:hypothetical protein M9H77_08512 [Catharanthus roseus]|uniref:Uncharacterized protein n=1 Tax=Catharanthus roseus TaxID=4058 RepID=A0ACC0BY82_CATRO|nr:hypothetical protein M9H77_08512 [Catharanthus roseus]